MKDTIHPFHLGSNVMIEIVNGNVRQLKAGTLEFIKEIPASSLNDQQITAIEAARTACSEASIKQGFRAAGYVNIK